MGVWVLSWARLTPEFLIFPSLKSIFQSFLVCELTKESFSTKGICTSYMKFVIFVSFFICSFLSIASWEEASFLESWAFDFFKWLSVLGTRWATSRRPANMFADLSFWLFYLAVLEADFDVVYWSFYSLLFLLGLLFLLYCYNKYVTD